MDNNFIEKNRKKIIIGIIVVVFLTLVGLVQVIRVVGGNISKNVNNQVTKDNSNTVATTTKPIVKTEAEKQKEQDNHMKELNKKEDEYNKNKVKLPTSSIVSNTNFNYQCTRGVAYLNGNYYVGFYCGLKEVWKAADHAQTNAIMLETMDKRGEDKSSADYQSLSDAIKRETPYIKEVQDMDMKTANPEDIQTAIKKYMMDTARMNNRNIDEQLFITMANQVFGDGTEYYLMAINPSGKADKSIANKKAIEYLNKLDDNAYPALNENILE